MSRVFLDTNFFIYLIENVGSNSQRAIYLLNALNLRGDQVFTSAMSFGEVLVHPMKRNDKVLESNYKRIFLNSGIRVLPFTVEAAGAFAAIRCNPSIKPPDAIQLATAGNHGCDLFLTNDEKLVQLQVPGIHFISTFESAPI